eukprot:CAMPEP_0194419462 /NCGR_PEP_ID=MMETSP0176-20130528/18602_1 /TAXON_ID=216777 /ORGANISM="Proboscia alata, Strain PI-D3" /LENGTH=38 /DNA_ID= /DNA_START= /DNA_END= /DNA_ORIENTATION=
MEQYKKRKSAVAKRVEALIWGSEVLEVRVSSERELGLR